MHGMEFSTIKKKQKGKSSIKGNSCRPVGLFKVSFQRKYLKKKILRQFSCLRLTRMLKTWMKPHHLTQSFVSPTSYSSVNFHWRLMHERDCLWRTG